MTDFCFIDELPRLLLDDQVNLSKTTSSYRMEIDGVQMQGHVLDAYAHADPAKDSAARAVIHEQMKQTEAAMWMLYGNRSPELQQVIKDMLKAGVYPPEFERFLTEPGSSHD